MHDFFVFQASIGDVQSSNGNVDYGSSFEVIQHKRAYQ